MITLHISDKSPAPAYMQIKQQLKNYIYEEDLSSGTMLPDVKTIAKLANVSLRTAFKGIDELIREGICYRRPKKGTYVNRETVKISKEKDVIGVYNIKDVSLLQENIVDSEMYRGITNKASNNKVDTFFMSGEASGSIEFYRNINEFSLKGIIILQCSGGEELQRLAERFKTIPFVALNYRFQNIERTPDNLFGVFNDDFAGAYQMGEHLLRQDIRRLTVVSLAISNENYSERVRGYQSAWANNSAPAPEIETLKLPSDVTGTQYNIAYKLAGKLLASGKRPEAVACVNDFLAEGIKDYFDANGKGDIKVVGYDNILKHISFGRNFSTVSVNFERIGATAVELLGSRKGKYPKITTITPDLIIR